MAGRAGLTPCPAAALSLARIRSSVEQQRFPGHPDYIECCYDWPCVGEWHRLIELPRDIAEYWYAVDWDVEALWALDLPARPFPIDRLLWHLDVPLWALDDRKYALTPRQVLRSPFRHAREYRRVRTASLVFPIEIMRLKGRWLILDGVHRLTRAHEDGLDEIMVRKVPRSLLRQGL